VGPPVPISPAAKDIPTLPGPTSQTPPLQAKLDVSITGGAGAVAVAALADANAPSAVKHIEPVITRALASPRIPSS
jgi:hypothetical protein